MGRTGKWFAYQHYGILPDITAVAKPIAGGIPMGAMLCTEEAARGFTPAMHGTTFGGGPLACAVAIAVLDTMQRQNMLAHIREVGELLPIEAAGVGDASRLRSSMFAARA